MAEPAPDPVNRPAGYVRGNLPVEPIEVIEALGLPHHLACAFKYLWRAGHKPGVDEIEDLKKSRWYLDRYLSVNGGAKLDLSTAPVDSCGDPSHHETMKRLIAQEDAATNRANKAEAEARAARRDHQCVGAAANRLQAEVVELRDQIQKKEAGLRNWRENDAKMEEVLKARQEESAERLERCAEYRKEIDSLRRALEKSEDELERTRKDAFAWESQARGAASSGMEDRERLKDARAEIAHLEGCLRVSHGDGGDAANEIHRLKATLDHVLQGRDKATEVAENARDALTRILRHAKSWAPEEIAAEAEDALNGRPPKHDEAKCPVCQSAPGTGGREAPSATSSPSERDGLTRGVRLPDPPPNGAVPRPYPPERCEDPECGLVRGHPDGHRFWHSLIDEAEERAEVEALARGKEAAAYEKATAALVEETARRLWAERHIGETASPRDWDDETIGIDKEKFREKARALVSKEA